MWVFLWLPAQATGNCPTWPQLLLSAHCCCCLLSPSQQAYNKVNKDCILFSSARSITLLLCMLAIINVISFPLCLFCYDTSQCMLWKRPILWVVSCRLWVHLLQIIRRLGQVHSKEVVLAKLPSFMMQLFDVYFYMCEAIYAKKQLTLNG